MWTHGSDGTKWHMQCHGDELIFGPFRFDDEMMMSMSWRLGLMLGKQRAKLI